MFLRFVVSISLVAFCVSGTASPNENTEKLSAMLGKSYDNYKRFIDSEFVLIYMSEFIREPYPEEMIQRFINSSSEMKRQSGAEPTQEDIEEYEAFYRSASRNQQNTFRKVRFIYTPTKQRMDRVEVSVNERDTLLGNGMEFTNTFINVNDASIWLDHPQQMRTTSEQAFEFFGRHGYHFFLDITLNSLINLGRMASGELDLPSETYFRLAFESELFSRIYHLESVDEKDGEIHFSIHHQSADSRLFHYVFDQESGLLVSEAQYRDGELYQEKRYQEYREHEGGNINLPMYIEVKGIDPHTNTDMQEKQRILDIRFEEIDGEVFDFTAYRDYHTLGGSSE